MSPTPDSPAPGNPGSGKKPKKKGAKKKLAVRTHTPRPDELTRETFEFITAIDDYKRNHMRSFLDDVEVLTVLRRLGYRPPGDGTSGDETGGGVGTGELEPTEEEQDSYARMRARYREEHGRLFPTWSEIFKLLCELGYSRAA